MKNAGYSKKDAEVVLSCLVTTLDAERLKNEAEQFINSISDELSKILPPRK